MIHLQRLLRLLRRAPRGQVVVLVLLLLAGSLTEGIGFILLVPLLSSLTGGEAENAIVRQLLDLLAALNIPPTPVGFLAVFVALIAVRSALQFARDRSGLLLQHQVVDHLREVCISRLLRADWRWITEQTRTDHMTLVLGEVNRVGNGLSAGLTLLTTLATALAYFAAAFIFSPAMAGLVLLAAAVGYVAMRRIRASALRLGSQQVDANRDLMANVQQSFGGLKLTKILGSEARHIDLLVRTVARVRRNQLRFGIETSLMRNLQQVIGAALLALYVLVGLTWLELPLAELLALTFLFARLMPLLLSAQQFLHRWLNAEPALEAIDRFIAESGEHAEAVADDTSVEWPVVDGIDLKDVSLTYARRDRPALHEINLRLPARTTTAITGPSGAGKSTLADILMGLIAPDEGTVTIDGVQMNSTSRVNWRRNVAYVPQDTFLFHDTIRANLLFGNPAATESELVAALAQAAADFVMELQDGLDTVVGDNGVRLSGGERQRIALARALLRQPSLLILDEATSALDAGNEAAISKALTELHGRLTIVIVGHRTGTLRHADQVVEMRAGRIPTTIMPVADADQAT